MSRKIGLNNLVCQIPRNGVYLLAIPDNACGKTSLSKASSLMCNLWKLSPTDYLLTWVITISLFQLIPSFLPFLVNGLCCFLHKKTFSASGNDLLFLTMYLLVTGESKAGKRKMTKKQKKMKKETQLKGKKGCYERLMWIKSRTVAMLLANSSQFHLEQNHRKKISKKEAKLRDYWMCIGCM